MSVDPGARTGVAVFEDGELRVVFASSKGIFTSTAVDVLVIEIPQIYRASKSRGDPNDLIKVAVLAGKIIGRINAPHTVEVHPATWKGQVPKNVHNARVLARLSPEERAKVPAVHDAIDAVGLGLWFLKRL